MDEDSDFQQKTPNFLNMFDMALSHRHCKYTTQDSICKTTPQSRPSFRTEGLCRKSNQNEREIAGDHGKNIPYYSLSSDNKGYKMLHKLGWDENKGLGKNNQGRIEPIGVQIKKDRKGIGIKSMHRQNSDGNLPLRKESSLNRVNLVPKKNIKVSKSKKKRILVLEKEYEEMLKWYLSH